MTSDMSHKSYKDTNNQHKPMKEFSRFACEYNTYNQIQTIVANELVNMIEKREYGSIVDIGCGTGSVYKNCIEKGIIFSNFYATDGSIDMLFEHPESAKIEKQLFNFNLESSCVLFAKNRYDLLLSSSALQWCSNLENTLSHLSCTSKYLTASLFTNNTFKTIHGTAKINSPLQSSKEFIKAFDKYYDATYELRSYKLHFKSKEEMFRYIKHSGVSGGKHQMGYKETKALIVNYPYDYLEFEVLFVSGKSRSF